MGESQSRYSIVERLSDKKLALMQERDSLEEDIANMKTQLAAATRRKEQWMKDVELENKRKERSFDNEIEELGQRVRALEKGVDMRRKSYDTRIAEINKALETIETVSKQAGGSNE